MHCFSEDDKALKWWLIFSETLNTLDTPLVITAVPITLARRTSTYNINLGCE